MSYQSDEAQDYLKEQEKSNECWWCGTLTEKHFCSEHCRTMWISES